MKKLSLTLLFSMAAMLTPFTSARADEVLTYTGPEFSDNGYSCGIADFNGLGCSQLKNDSITATFDLTTPLGDDFSGIVDPTSWSMSSAGVTLTNTTPGVQTYFDIATDANGNIIDWALLSSTPSPGVAILTTNDPDGNITVPYNLSGSDDSLYATIQCAQNPNGTYPAGPCFALALLTSNAGTWTEETTLPLNPTPEPWGTAVIALGVLGAAALWKRHLQRKRVDDHPLPDEDDQEPVGACDHSMKALRDHLCADCVLEGLTGHKQKSIRAIMTEGRINVWSRENAHA